MEYWSVGMPGNNIIASNSYSAATLQYSNTPLLQTDSKMLLRLNWG